MLQLVLEIIQSVFAFSPAEEATQTAEGQSLRSMDTPIDLNMGCLCAGKASYLTNSHRIFEMTVQEGETAGDVAIDRVRCDRPGEGGQRRWGASLLIFFGLALTDF